MRPAVKKSISVLAAFFAVWLAARFLLPLCFPFLLGALLAFAAEPMVGFLQKRRVPRCVCSGIGVSMAFCFLAMLVLILCAFALRELRRVAGVLPDLEDTAKSGIGLLQSWLLELASRAPQSVQPLLSENVTSFFSNGTSLLDKVIRYILGLAGNILSHIPDGALSLGTAVISSFLISARLPKIKSWLKKRLPEEKLKPAADALKRMKNAVGGWLTAQLKLMGVTFTILTLGFVVLRIAYAPLWALVVALVDALPEMTDALRAAAPAAERRVIPLYTSPAAAGFAAPVFGEDYELIPVTGDVPPGAELAVRIQGDSMAPVIADGAVVYVNHDPVQSGDVGIFCVDGDMLCKQYYRDPLGMVYLFSLNRKRADMDVIFHRGSGRSLTCFGRVMLHAQPLPEGHI